MTAEARWAFGPKWLMLESHPKAYLPAFSAVCNTAAESVFWNSTSAPWFSRLCAPSVSLGGSNQALTQTTLVLILGFTLWAPRVKELMLRITSGMGIEPTTPKVLVLVIEPAITPAM